MGGGGGYAKITYPTSKGVALYFYKKSWKIGDIKQGNPLLIKQFFILNKVIIVKVWQILIIIHAAIHK
jgi:hypothetical protein